MKRAIAILGCILLGVLVFPLLGEVLSAWLRYTFQLTNYMYYTWVVAFLAGAEGILWVVSKKAADSKWLSGLFCFALFLFLGNMLCCISELKNPGMAAGCFLCVICCSYLTFKQGKLPKLKLTGVVLAVLTGMLAVFLCFVNAAFGSVYDNQVVLRLESPGGAYYAEVIDSDQGALGGNTFVDVTVNGGVDCWVFETGRKPQRIYRGTWNVYATMEIEWIGENCLLINGVEYIIP